MSAIPKALRRLAAGVLAGLALSGCVYPGSHGPAEDHSEFAGAVLLADRTVLFSFKHLVYRPARGLAAFPDGGVPRYLADEDVLGAYDIPTATLRVLLREPNRRYTDGQGRFGIQRSQGTVALVTRGGQLRKDLSQQAYEDWLVDAATGERRPLDYRTALPAQGRALTQLYLVDGRGTLLFETAPLADPPPKGDDSQSWLWVRTADGKYLPVAQTSHYERTNGDEVIYWIPATRRFHAFNVVSLSTRELPGYRPPPYQDVVEGVSVDHGGKRILFGRKRGDVWEYEPLALAPDQLK